MEFHSANFFIFFLAIFFPYLLFRQARVWVLAAANLLFYAAAGLGPLLLFLAITLVTYITVHAIIIPNYVGHFG